MGDLSEIFRILPEDIGMCIKKIGNIERLQEIRLKINKPIIFQIGDTEKVSSKIASEQDLKLILQRISNYSVYAFEEEIKQGYITIRGGHRVGLCGRCVLEKNSIKTIKDIASINIRISREVIGCSEKLLNYILHEGKVKNTIIISPPKCGKTTIIRDIARNISDGSKKLRFYGKKVCVIDERSEIGACYKGVPQMNIGMRTDVLDSCPKSQGIMMAIRSMSPEVIICDEIGTYNDMDSILMALNSGINLITTIHGFNIEDIFSRNVFKEIIENKVFQIGIVLSNRKGVGTIEYIYDFDRKHKILEVG